MHVRLTFSQWSKANKRAKIIEVEPGWTIDVSDRIVSMDIKKERDADDERGLAGDIEGRGDPMLRVAIPPVEVGAVVVY